MEKEGKGEKIKNREYRKIRKEETTIGRTEGKREK